MKRLAVVAQCGEGNRASKLPDFSCEAAAFWNHDYICWARSPDAQYDCKFFLNFEFVIMKSLNNA